MGAHTKSVARLQQLPMRVNTPATPWRLIRPITEARPAPKGSQRCWQPCTPRLSQPEEVVAIAIAHYHLCSSLEQPMTNEQKGPTVTG